MRYLYRLGFVCKRLKKQFAKADAAQRTAFVCTYAEIVEEAQGIGATIFFTDEAHFRADAERTGLWVPKGEPALVSSTSPRRAEEAGMRAYLLLADWDRTAFYGPSRFQHDAQQDAYRCPEGHPLHPATVRSAKNVAIYRADPTICNACPAKAACTSSKRGRTIQRAAQAAFVERVQTYRQEPPLRTTLSMPVSTVRWS